MHLCVCVLSKSEKLYCRTGELAEGEYDVAEKERTQARLKAERKSEKRMGTWENVHCDHTHRKQTLLNLHETGAKHGLDDILRATHNQPHKEIYGFRTSKKEAKHKRRHREGLFGIE